MHHYQELLTALVAELRARHFDIAEGLIALRVSVLETELAATKERTRQLLADAQK